MLVLLQLQQAYYPPSIPHSLHIFFQTISRETSVSPSREGRRSSAKYSPLDKHHQAYPCHASNPNNHSSRTQTPLESTFPIAANATLVPKNVTSVSLKKDHVQRGTFESKLEYECRVDRKNVETKRADSKRSVPDDFSCDCHRSARLSRKG